LCVCVKERELYFSFPLLLSFHSSFLPSLLYLTVHSCLSRPVVSLASFLLAVVQVCSVIHDSPNASPQLFSASIANCKREGVKCWWKEGPGAITHLLLFLEAIYFYPDVWMCSRDTCDAECK
jgi:hypothetical protein